MRSRSRANLFLLAAACALGTSAPALRADEPPCPAEPAAPEAPGLMAAIERAASASADPAPTRLRLLARMQFAPTCYPGDLTPAQLDDLIARTELLPPGAQSNFGPRFIADGKCWTGAAMIGDTGTSRPAQLTYSFPDDGVTWGNTCSGYNSGPNNLNARLAGTYMYTDANGTHTYIGPFSPNIDRGREFIRSALAAWRAVGGLTYLEVTDDNAPMDLDPTHPTTRGDIRIGGWGFSGTPVTPSGPLAYNALPGSQLASCNGGDMTINTNYFTPAYLNSVSSGNFLYFRNTVGHEHGHGLGYYHTVPCNQTKLMEPQIHTVVSLLSPDDIRAAIRNYGDRNATLGNHSAAAAKNYGNLTTPILRSVIERDVGVNGSSVVINSPFQVLAEDDWYKFTIDSTQSITISAAPTGYAPIGSCCVSNTCAITTQTTCTGSWTLGGTCSGGTTCVPPTTTPACNGTSTDPTWCQGAQTSSCSGASAAINAQSAGNLAVDLRASDGTTIVNSANSNTLGVTESMSQSLAPGTYYVHVYDSGGGAGWTSANQTIQTYDLTIRVGTSKAPPFVIAGLQRKRVAADTSCSFIGNHNSYATEPGASLLTANYAWDLDGDGTFETTGQTQPFFTYRSNGTYTVSLQITDTNSMSATDTIQVVVYGATTTITSTNPNAGSSSTTVPVTIFGSNFKGVTLASQVTVSGTGVTITGTPVPNGAGTRITGLSFVIASNAPSGARDITVTNSDGAGASGTGSGVFTVNGVVTTGACCAADGTCAVTTQGACSGTFQTLGSSCNPNNCPQPSVACCAADASCTFVTAAACTSGTAQAYGSSCNPNNCPLPSVACCAANGGCTFVTAANCTSGTPQSVGSSCNPNVCPQPSVACCAASGSCSMSPAASCVGTPQSLGSTCNPNICPQPAVACCAADGSCTFVSSTFCSGSPMGYPSSCSPNTCAQPSVACCAANGTCSFGTVASCTSGTPQSSGSSCSPNVCPQPNIACCASTGACTFTTAAACTGNPQSFGSSCSPNICPQPPAACCAPDGTCTVVSAPFCSGTPQGSGSSCSPNICPQPSVACCFADGTCTFVTAASCTAGTPGAFGTSCSPNNCPQPTGACCVGVTCVARTSADCSGSLTRFAGVGASCNGPGNRTNPCCYADFNQNGTITVDDIFDYLNAWFNSNPATDINGGGIVVQDIFDFLNAWFSGC